MTAPTTNPSVPPPPSPGSVGRPRSIGTDAAAAQNIEGAGERQSSSSVRALRVRSALLILTISAFAVVGTIAGLISRNATAAAESNTAPSLVGVQDLFASVAESNTAATGAFLSSVNGGQEDRVQRNLYEDAIRRASDKTEQVASLVGNNEEAHQSLQEIAASLNSYSGQIESSRLAVQLGEAGAELRLRDSLKQTQAEIDFAVRTISVEMQSQLDSRSAEGRTLTIVAIVLGFICLLALVATQWFLFRATNRLFNLPMLVATALILATTVALARSTLVRQAAIDNAFDGGYASITTAAEIQRAAYALQSGSNLTLLGNAGSDLDELETSVDLGIIKTAQDADSAREEAAAAELAARWERYLATPTTDPNLQFANFNGLNTSIESVLLDNTAQFNSGVASAAAAVRNSWIYVLVGSVLGLLASLYGLQLRMREYS